jgi:mannosyltransferase
MATLARMRERWLLLFILILAAFLRFYRLDGQSFWNDEGNSARIAERSLQLITEGAAGDIHPPLYYYLLHFWRGIFGAGEGDLRSLSTVLGIVLVLLTFVIARRVFDGGIGLAAALVAAINPFQIYYSQEARMYMLLAVIGAASTLALLRLLEYWSAMPQASSKPVVLSSRHFVALSLPILYAAGLYTHYAFPFIIFAHFVVVIAWIWVTRARLIPRVLPWLGLTTAAFALFLPWLPIAVRQITTWPSGPVGTGTGSILLDTLSLYVLGQTFPTAEAGAVLLVGGFFLIISLWNPDVFDEPAAEAGHVLPHSVRLGAIVLWWLVPIAAIFGLGLFKESYLKFLLIGSPAFCILLARGITTALGIARGALNMPRELRGQPVMSWAWTLVVVFLVGLIAVPTTASLQNYYFDPEYARDDYRGIARDILAHQRAGDAVILDSANQWEVFTYYYPDGPNVYPLPRKRPLDQAAVESELGEISRKYSRLFVLYWGDAEADPQRVIESWLDAHTYLATERWVGSVRLVTYAVPGHLSDKPDIKSNARFGEHIHLVGFSTPNRRLQAGDVLQLDLFWFTDVPLRERYKVFVHVLDGTGGIIAQADREPGGGLRPTTTWGTNELIVDRYGVMIPENTPSGTYAVEIGLYDFAGHRLKTDSGGDALVVTQVEVKSDK